MVMISPEAREYIKKLLSNVESGTGVCIFVKSVDSVFVEGGMRFCSPNEFCSSDFIYDFTIFLVYIFRSDIKYLKGVEIGVVVDGLGVQLTIKVPNIKNVPDDNCTSSGASSVVSFDLISRVRNVLDLKINPQLELHGGRVSLIEITHDFFVVIQFYGGCNGCSMASYTIKKGIEMTLMKLFPELRGVVDSTVHNRGSHSYF